MTPQAQQIAIALACGCRWYWTTDGLTEDGSAFKWKANLCYPPEEGIGKAWIGCAGESREMTQEEIAEVTRTGAFYTYAPRYLESLDAMYKVEEMLTQDECWTMYEHLSRLMFFTTPPLPAAKRWLWHATAAQRAEAFLRAKGLWVEEDV